jgi:flagella basal body P-ring formation protein FlgA
MTKLIFLLAALATPAAAQFQNIPALQARVVAALGAGVGEPGGPADPIDMRLKLQPCPQPVQIDPPAMGAIALRCPAVGWRIRVPLQRFGGSGGMNSGFVQAVVRRGDPVDLIAGSGGFSVSVSAIAQEDGAPGARIRVKTDGGGKPQGQILFAEVVDAGRVKLPGFN